MVVEILFIILIALGLAYLLARVARKLGFPKSVGQIIAGIILSVVALKYPLFNIENLKVLEFLANFGIILLFYYIGLSLNFNTVKNTLKKSLILSIFKTIVPFVLGFVITYYYLKLEILPSLIIGLVLTTSAQSVSVSLLDELKILKSKLGTKIIGVGVITDLFELFFVTIILGAFAISSTSISQLIFGILFFLIFLAFARTWLIPQTLKYLESDKNSTDRFTGALLILLILVAVSEFLQVGALVGAIIAGIMVKQTIFKEKTIPNWEQYDISRSVHIISFGFLIPLFFVWIGFNTNILEIIINYKYIAIFSAISLIGIIGGILMAGIFTKDNIKENFIIGWGLTPKGDIGFVLLILALEQSAISNQIFSSMVLMSLLLTIISPIFFKKLIQKNKKEILRNNNHNNLKSKGKTKK